MGARDITGPMLRRCFGAVHKGVTPAKILKDVLESMASAQRDADITGDVDMAHYYEGMVDAFEAVAMFIAPVKRDKEHLLNQLLSKSGTRFSEEIAA